MKRAGGAVVRPADSIPEVCKHRLSLNLTQQLWARGDGSWVVHVSRKDLTDMYGLGGLCLHFLQPRSLARQVADSELNPMSMSSDSAFKRRSLSQSQLMALPCT